MERIKKWAQVFLDDTMILTYQTATSNHERSLFITENVSWRRVSNELWTRPSTRRFTPSSNHSLSPSSTSSWVWKRRKEDSTKNQVFDLTIHLYSDMCQKNVLNLNYQNYHPLSWPCRGSLYFKIAVDLCTKMCSLLTQITVGIDKF